MAIYLIVPAILAILCLMVAINRYRVHLYAWRLGFPQPKYRVVIERDVKVPMLDGILLSADVYKPEKRGKYPVLVARTPYNKAGTIFSYKEVAALFASQGYVVVIQDVRGKYASDGKFLPYFHEALDGHSTISWAGTASWSNGNVALVGTSYLGSCAWLATQYANPHLRAIMPMFTTYDTYSIWMDHGLPFLKGPLTWLSEYSEKKGNADFAYSRIEQVLWKLPVSELDVSAVGHPIPFYREYLTHRVPDQFWEKIGPSHIDKLEIPALIVGGWYDPFVRGTIDDYQRMVQSANLKSQLSELWIGPWAHNPAQEFKGVDFGKKAGLNILLKTCLHWSDQWLKLNMPAAKDDRRIHYFVMGKNEWRATGQWPPENMTEEKLFLQGEGRLSDTLPAEPHTRQYVYNPRDPALFIGSHLLYTDGWIMPVEQEDQTERHDVLVYTSEPFEEELEIAGNIKLIFHVSSTALDTDFCAKLCTVHSNGKVYNLSPGFLRMRYRESLTDPKWMEPGQIYRVEIHFRPVAHAFLKNQRIQLQITSADFPIHNRNLNTGMSCEYTTEIKEALQSVYTGGVYDSHLLLPVVR